MEDKITRTKSVNRLFLITVILYIGVSFAIGALTFLKLSMNVSMILSEALILIPSVVYLKIKHIKIKEMIPFRKIKFSTGILTIVCTYLMYPLLIVLNAFTLFFVKSGTAELMESAQRGNFLISVLLIAVLPAFAEEFVFRGVLFQTYKESRMLLGIILSGFLFGCMHMNFNQFLYAFVLGIYLAFLMEATGSILSPMLAHFTINFTSVVITNLSKYMNQFAMENGVTENPFMLQGLEREQAVLLIFGVMLWAVIAIGTTAGAIGILIGISKISGRWEHLKNVFRLKKRGKLITIPLLIAILLMSGMMLLS